MIEEIEKRLADGEIVELECVDRIGLLKDIDRSEANEEILDQGSLVVDYIDYDGDIRLVGHIDDFYLNVIASEEFKYFRIKQAPTFDDLIDVLIKAKKDNIISRVEIKRNSLNATVNVTESRITEFCTSKDAGDIVFKERIDWINSLYTETFVIESEDDMSKFNNAIDSIILANGEDIIDIVMFNRNEPYFTNGGVSAVKVPFAVLKGATVTQKR